MIKIIAVVLAAITSQPVAQFSSLPLFETLEQCQEFIKVNDQKLRDEIWGIVQDNPNVPDEYVVEIRCAS